MYSLDKLHSALAEHGHRSTAARKQVYSILASATQPLSNSEIIDRVSNIDKVSVYRTLDLYESIGVVHRIWNGFKSKVELSDPFSPHHHHFTCASCGKVISFKSKDIERAMENLERTMGVTIDYHLVEINGRCDSCQNNR
jgi:Fur family ferric uptake transcriptional regulator